MHFYWLGRIPSLLHNGKSEDALRNAVERFSDQTSQNPYYWAAFVKFKSLRLPNPEETQRVSKQLVRNLEFSDEGRFEPYDLVKYRDKLYANGVFIEYTNQPRRSVRSVMINIEDNTKFWLPPNFSVFSFLNDKQNALKMIGIVGDGLKRDPAIMKVDPENQTIEIAGKISVSRMFNEKDAKYNVEMGIVHASFEHKDGSLSLVIQALMNPDNKNYAKYMAEDDFVLANYWYLKLNPNYETLEKKKLPYDRVGAEFKFFDERLFVHETDIASNEDFKFLNEWGQFNCDRTSVTLYEYNFSKNSFSNIKKFPGVMSLKYAGSGKALLEEHCDYPTYTKVYDLIHNTTSTSLPITMGSVSATAVPLGSEGLLYFGTEQLPVSFLKLKEVKRDESLNIVYETAEMTNRKNYVTAPNSQFFKFLVYQDKKGLLYNLDLQFSRFYAFYNDGLIDDGWLYLLETSDRQTVSVSRINLKEITQKAVSLGLQ